MSYTYDDNTFKWIPVKEVSKKLVEDYKAHYSSLSEEQVVGILHEYMKESVIYGNIGAASTAAVIALVGEVNRRMDGKFKGGSSPLQNMFILDFCKRYSEFIYADKGCVSIW